MLISIEQKLSAIKAINTEKDQLDSLIQSMQLNPQGLSITIDSKSVSDHLSELMKTELQHSIITSLQGKREVLIDKAKELMK